MGQTRVYQILLILLDRRLETDPDLLRKVLRWREVLARILRHHSSNNNNNNNSNKNNNNDKK